MPTVTVALGEKSYDVLVARGLLKQAGAECRRVLPAAHRVAVISDATVAALHAPQLLESLKHAGLDAGLHTVPAGEASKSMDHAATLCRELIRAGHDRHSTLIALGGGVVGDLAGFVAAIFFRGIPFVQIPTTIVAQVDSSVGGKTGVNAPEGKNLIGCFHQPSLVLVDPETLATLPDREFREGFAEAIKHAAIREPAMLADLATIAPSGRAVPADLIARNIAIKARIVEADEHETLDLRALLNFGHTIGHGIEAAVPYGGMLHGEAIALGLRAALFLSRRHAGLEADAETTILRLLAHFQLPLQLPDSITTDAVMERLARDKKFRAGRIRFVLLHAPGDARVCSTLHADDLRLAIEHLRLPPPA